MKYESIKGLEEEKFRRLTGVKRATFAKMIGILSEADKQKKAKGGRKSRLTLEDRLLMALEYIRYPVDRSLYKFQPSLIS